MQLYKKEDKLLEVEIYYEKLKSSLDKRII